MIFLSLYSSSTKLTQLFYFSKFIANNPPFENFYHQFYHQINRRLFKVIQSADHRQIEPTQKRGNSLTLQQKVSSFYDF